MIIVVVSFFLRTCYYLIYRIINWWPSWEKKGRQFLIFQPIDRTTAQKKEGELLISIGKKQKCDDAHFGYTENRFSNTVCAVPLLLLINQATQRHFPAASSE